MNKFHHPEIFLHRRWVGKKVLFAKSWSYCTKQQIFNLICRELIYLPVAPVNLVLSNSLLLVKFVSHCAHEYNFVPLIWSKNIRPILLCRFPCFVSFFSFVFHLKLVKLCRILWKICFPINCKEYNYFLFRILMKFLIFHLFHFQWLTIEPTK